jgi:hypothetical protein
MINGWKSAFQQMQQSIVMFVAALTATSKITAEAGAGVLILLGTIQVALAMPEQIMGVIKTFVLKGGDKNAAPDFPMTAPEIDLKVELSVGIQKKIDSMKGLVNKVMALKPHMLDGNVEEVFRCILMDKELMETFNLLRPGCLNGLFGMCVGVCCLCVCTSGWVRVLIISFFCTHKHAQSYTYTHHTRTCTHTQVPYLLWNL